MLEFVRQATAEDALAGPRSLAEMHAAHVERRRREMAPGMAAEAEKRRAAAKAKADAAAAGKRPVLTKAEAKAQKQRTALAATYALQVARAPRGPRVRSLLAATSEEFDVSPLDLLSSRRSAHVALARQAAMYVALITTTWSTPQVGRYFGGRDHTTVMHARDKIAALIAADPEFAARVARIAASVRPAPYIEQDSSA